MSFQELLWALLKQNVIQQNVNSNEEWKWNISVIKIQTFLIHSPDELYSQSQISYTAGPVSFHQYVLTLQIPVSNSRFALRAKDLCVEVTEPGHRGIGQAQHSFIVQSGWFEVVIQRSIFMVVGD